MRMFHGAGFCSYIRGFFCVLLSAVLLIAGDRTAVLQAQSLYDGTMSSGGIVMETENTESREMAESEREALQLYAQSAVLLDADSGRVLYEKNGFTPMAMASTTKIMTCIVVLENGDLNDKAQVSAYAASMPKVKLYVKKGEEYSVRSLMFSLMLESHNDSAVVLAEYIGSRYLQEELLDKPVSEYTTEESKKAVKAFAGLMNQKAAEIGCAGTWFITPNGLDAEETVQNESGEWVKREHSTTAEDLAKIMAYCVKRSPGRDVFREITAAESYSFYENGRNFTCVNHNAFLNMMDGAFSGKTGFTNKAGYCYVGALEDEGRTFVVALLACGWPNNKTYKWKDASVLMRYGLEHFRYREIGGEDTAFDEELLKPVKVEGGRTKRFGDTAAVGLKLVRHKEAVKLLMREDEEIEVRYQWNIRLEAPVTAGTKVGSVTYNVNGRTYLEEDIVTAGNVERVDLGWYIEELLRRFLIFRKCI